MVSDHTWKNRQPALDWTRIATSNLTEPNAVVQRLGGEYIRCWEFGALTHGPLSANVEGGGLPPRTTQEQRERERERESTITTRKSHRDGEPAAATPHNTWGGRTCCLPSPVPSLPSIPPPPVPSTTTSHQPPAANHQPPATTTTTSHHLLSYLLLVWQGVWDA